MGNIAKIYGTGAVCRKITKKQAEIQTNKYFQLKAQ
jgi:hypothetical protein